MFRVGKKGKANVKVPEARQNLVCDGRKEGCGWKARKASEVEPGSPQGQAGELAGGGAFSDHSGQHGLYMGSHWDGCGRGVVSRE